MSDFDFAAISTLAADLGRVPDNAGKNVRQATEITARNIKDSWRDKLSGSEGLSAAGRSISYNTKTGANDRGSTISIEIKPRLGGQGSLVFVPELGSLATAPRGYGRSSLAENSDDFVDGLAKALEDAEREAGL